MARRQVNRLPRGVEAIRRAGGRVVYRGRWRDREDPNVRYSTECFDTPREAKVQLEAERNASDAEHDKRNSHRGTRYRERRDVADTLEAVGDAYLAQLQAEHSTIESYRTTLRAAAAFFGADRRVAEIDRPLVKQWVKSMAKAGRVWDTQLCRISVLRGVFRFAIIELELVAKNPCDGVSPEGDRDGERRVGRYPTEREIMDCYAAMPARTAPLVFLGADSGLRRSELAALCWSHLDLERRTVLVERMVDATGQWRLGTKGRRRSKTGGRAVVPLSPRAVEALRALREAYPAEDADRVFRQRNGSGYAPMTLWGHWRNARLKVMGPAEVNVRLHDLRWHAATTAAEANIPLHEVGVMMRHSSPRMTHRYLAQPDISVMSSNHDRAFGHLTASA